MFKRLKAWHDEMVQSPPPSRYFFFAFFVVNALMTMGAYRDGDYRWAIAWAALAGLNITSFLFAGAIEEYRKIIEGYKKLNRELLDLTRDLIEGNKDIGKRLQETVDAIEVEKAKVKA